MKKEGYTEMAVITTECYDLSLLVYPSVGEQHCNGPCLIGEDRIPVIPAPRERKYGTAEPPLPLFPPA